MFYVRIHKLHAKQTLTNVVGLITAIAPISVKSSKNVLVFRLQPVYFYFNLRLYKDILLAFI